jgi:UDP-2-acetamido-3-amino-2,3-dideoxy-glucuronate N-acetyltransferase
MKLGLIGGGYWGKNLIRDFNSHGVLHTICEIDDNMIRKYNEEYPDIKTTKIWQEVLENPEINAVCISLPAEMHYEYAKLSLLAGKDVYVEKPITLNIDEAKKLTKLAKDLDRILMVGHLLHYHPCIQKI